MKKIILGMIIYISFFTFAMGEKAVDFYLKDQYGVEQSLEKYRGKIVFLNFWVSWCPTCRSETNIKMDLYKKYNKNTEDIIFLGVNNEEIINVKSYINQKRFSVPTVLGAKEVFEAYGIKHYPTTFIIDREGNIVEEMEEKKLSFEGVEKIIAKIDG